MKVIVTSLLYVFSRMPWWWLRVIGRLLGQTMFYVDSREAKNTSANLKIAYPALSEIEHQKLVKQTLIETALTFVELPRIWLNAKGLDNRIDNNGFAEKMRELLSKNKGLIVSMPHLGNWELVATASASEAKILGLYRPPRQAFLETVMNKGRNNSHVTAVPTTRAGLMALNKALKAGDVVAILPDQVPKASASASVIAPFFGRDSLTMVLLGRMAAKHQSPVLFAWAQRLENGRYRIEHFVAEQDISSKTPEVAARVLNQSIEQCVANAPAQYQWAYRRYEPVNDTQNNPYQ